MDDRGHDVHGHVFQQVKIETPCWPGYPLLHATRPMEPFPGKGRDVRARSMDWICGFPRGAFTRGDIDQRAIPQAATTIRRSRPPSRKKQHSWTVDLQARQVGCCSRLLLQLCGEMLLYKCGARAGALATCSTRFVVFQAV
jgi:hypothetical protein